MTTIRRQIAAVRYVKLGLAHEQINKRIVAKRARTALRTSRHCIAQQAINRGAVASRRVLGCVVRRRCLIDGGLVRHGGWQTRLDAFGAIVNVKVACGNDKNTRERWCETHAHTGMYASLSRSTAIFPGLVHAPVTMRQAPRTPRDVVHSDWVNVRALRTREPM